jgi:hypothetical protein
MVVPESSALPGVVVRGRIQRKENKPRHFSSRVRHLLALSQSVVLTRILGKSEDRTWTATTGNLKRPDKATRLPTAAARYRTDPPLDLMRLWRGRFPSLPYLLQPFCEPLYNHIAPPRGGLGAGLAGSRAPLDGNSLSSKIPLLAGKAQFVVRPSRHRSLTKWRSGLNRETGSGAVFICSRPLTIRYRVASIKWSSRFTTLCRRGDTSGIPETSSSG